MADQLEFAAIDFETANERRDSACAVAVVQVRSGVIAARHHWRIRPPTRRFRFTRIHGIRWVDVRDAPPFLEVWPEVSRVLEGSMFLAAHNAGFERSVLRAGGPDAARVARTVPFLCTVRLAREIWSLRRVRLPDVCGFLGIALDHHDALSDAEACARIVLAARRDIPREELLRRATR